MKTEPVVLRDGSAAEIRPLRAGDRRKVTALFGSCSDKSLYTRFFTVGHDIVDRHIEHLFASGTGTSTYVLLRSGTLLGIADVEPCGDRTAEIAFLVSDDAHNLGIATLLLERAARDAEARGIEWFVADVLLVNRQMVEVFDDAGFPLERHIDHGDVSVRMRTHPDAAGRSTIVARHANSLANLGKESVTIR